MANEVRDELDVHKCMICHLVIHGLEGFILHSKTCTWKNYNCSYTLENPPYLRPLGMPSPAVSYRSSPTLTCSSSDDGDFEKINEDLRHYYTSLVTEEEEDCLKENGKTESIVGSVTDGTKESLALGVDEGNGKGSMLLECSQNNATTSLPSNQCRELGHVDVFAGIIEDAHEERMPQLVDENRSLNIGHLDMEGDQKDVSYQETVVNIEWEFKTLKQGRGRSERRRDRCRGRKGTSCTSKTQEKCLDEVGNGEYSENGPVAVNVVESKVKKNRVRSREKRWKRACPTDTQLRNAENIVESKVSKQSGYLRAEGGGDSLVNPVDSSVRDRVVEKCVVNFPSSEKQKISGSDKFCQSMTKNTVGGSRSRVNSLRKKRDYSASRVGEVNCSTLALETEQSFSKISRGSENLGADKSVCDSDSVKVEDQEMSGARTEFRESKIANFENKSDKSLSYGSERTLDGTTAVETSDEIDCRDQFCRVLETMNSIHGSSSGENEQTPSPTKSVSVVNEPDGHSPPGNKQKHNADSGEMQQAAGESPSNAENLVCDGSPFSIKERVDSEGAQMGVICARGATQTSTPRKKFFMQSLELNPLVPPKRANDAPSGISPGDESSRKASGLKETYVTISVVKKPSESKDGEGIGSADGSWLSSGVPLISPPREEGRTVALSEFISSCKNLPSWREYRDRGTPLISEVRGLESPETIHNLSSSSGSIPGAADSDPEVTEMSAITESMRISNGGGAPRRELPSAGIINAGMDRGSDGRSKAYRRKWGGKRRTLVVRRSSKKQSASDENELDFMSKKALIEKLCPMLEDKSMDIYIDHNYFCLFPAALKQPTSSESGQNIESIIKGAVDRVAEKSKELNEGTVRRRKDEKSDDRRRKSVHRSNTVGSGSNDADAAVNIPGYLDENVGNSSPNEKSYGSRRKSPHRIRRDISSNDADVAVNIPGNLDENVGDSSPKEKSNSQRRKSLHRSKTRRSHSNDADVAVNIPGNLDENVGNSSPNDKSNSQRRKSLHRSKTRGSHSNDADVAVNIPGNLDENVGNSSPNDKSNSQRRKSLHRSKTIGSHSNDADVAVNIPGNLDENVGNSSPNKKSNSQRRKSLHRSKTRRSHSNDADVAVNIPGNLDENVGNSSSNEKSKNRSRKFLHRSKNKRSHSNDAYGAVNIPGDLDKNVGNSSPNKKSNSQRRKSLHRNKTRRLHSNDADVAVNIPGNLDENVGNSSSNEKSKNRSRKSLHRSKNKRSHSNDAYGAVNIPGDLDKNVGNPSSNECLDRNGNVGQCIERSKVVPAGREPAVPGESLALSDNASSSSNTEISLTSDVSKSSVHKAETCGKRDSPAKDLSDNVVTRGVGVGTSESVNESGALGEFPTSQFVLEDIRSLSKETWAKMDVYKPGNRRKQGINANPIDEEGHAVTNWPVTTFGEKKSVSADMGTLPKSPLACSKNAPDTSSGSLSVLNATKEISARSSDKKITKASSGRNIKKRKRDLKRSLKKTGEKCLKEITGKHRCDQTKLFARVTVDLGFRCDSEEFKRQQLGQHALTSMTSSDRQTASSLDRENEQLTMDSVSKPSTVDEVGHCPGDGNRSDTDGIISVDIFNNLKLLKPVFSKLGNCIDLAPAHNGGVLQSLVIHPMRKLEQQKSRMTQMVRVDYNKFDGNGKCQCTCRRKKELVRHSDVHHLLDESQDACTIDHPWECYLDPSKCVCKCDVNVSENPVGPSGSETKRNIELLPTDSLEFSFSDRLVRSLLQNNLIGQPASFSRNSPLISGSTSSKTSLDKASSERSKIISRKEIRAPSLEMSGLPNETLLNSSINSFDDPPKLCRRSQRLRKSVDRLTYFRELTVKRRLRFRGHKVGEHTPFDYDSDSESSTSVMLKRPSGTGRFRRHRKSAKKLSTHNDGYVTDYYYSCSEETMEKIDFPLKRATSIGSDLDVLEKEVVGSDGSTSWEFGSTKNTVPENRKMPLRSCKSISALNSFYSEKYLYSY